MSTYYTIEEGFFKCRIWLQHPVDNTNIYFAVSRIAEKGLNSTKFIIKSKQAFVDQAMQETSKKGMILQGVDFVHITFAICFVC